MDVKSVLQQIFLNQLKIVNKTIQDIKNDPDFYSKVLLSEDEYHTWYKNSLELLVNNTDLNDQQAKRTLDHLDVAYGLLYQYTPKRVALPEYIDELILEIQQTKRSQKNKK